MAGPFPHHQAVEDVQTPLLENVVAGAPPVFPGLTKEFAHPVEQPLLPSRLGLPSPGFIFARKDVSGNTRPQAIAHRGYKAKFPENTMGAFRGAVEVGADAIETDIHLTKDGVVVLSHDKDLKRCFGRKERIIDCNYDFVRSLKTVKQPHERMPRLEELLLYLAQPGLENIWLMLDIKIDNNPDDVMRLIASTISSVQPSPSRPWQSRIVLGCWTAKFLPLCSQYLPGFAVSHIGFSLIYSFRFFSIPNVSFSMLQSILMTPWGRKFVRKAQCESRAVCAWTVNHERRMRWCIRNGLDGVITDDPKLFVEVRKSWHEGMTESFDLLMWLDVFRVNVFAFLMGLLFCTKLAIEKRLHTRSSSAVEEGRSIGREH